MKLIAENIQSWANAHINDPSPAYLRYDTPVDKRRAMGEAVRRYIDNMVFMYHMTDGTRYAEAAKRWLLGIANDWPAWNPDKNDRPAYDDGNKIREFATGFAAGYYALHDYLSAGELTTIRNHIEANIIPTYDRYKGKSHPLIGGAFFSSPISIGTAVALPAIAIGDDDPDKTKAWLNFGIAAVKDGMAAGTDDGGWIEGPTYGTRGAINRAFTFLDILRRMKGIDLFSTYHDFLSNVPYYFIYLNMQDDHKTGETPMQMEDTTGGGNYFSGTDFALCFLYKAASEYHDGYAQMAGNTYAKQDLALSYIWKDPGVTPLPISNLPLYRNFPSLGYVTWRAGWTADDLVFLFKSGRSVGHAHPNQNTFAVYKNGRPLTAPPGYAMSWTEYKVTWPNNCITVGNYRGNDGKLYGYGQAHEPGDLGGAGVPLGTRGIIQEAVFNNEYNYVRGDASALYTGKTVPEPAKLDWPALSSGDLDKWVRHIAFINDLQYFVIFDDVVSPTPQQVNWWYNALDIYNEDKSSAPPSLTMNSNLITQAVGDKRLEIKMLEPAAFNSEVRSNTGIYEREFSYVLLWPQTNTATPKFLSVMTVDNRLSSGALVTRKIQQGNCLGVMVDSGSDRDLILFSSDGKHVSEYIDLSGNYQSADGNSYKFSGTQVLADFDTYKVMRFKQGARLNRAPVFDPIGYKTVVEGQSLTFTVSANDPDGDSLTYSASNLPPWASFNAATRTFSGTANQIGSYPNVRFQVSDGLLTDTEDVTITVTANQAPVLTNPGDKSVHEGALLTFKVSATDPDGDPLTYSASNLPTGASFNPETRTFSWTPAHNQAGPYPNIHFEVSDGRLKDARDITITVVQPDNGATARTPWYRTWWLWLIAGLGVFVATGAIVLRRLR